jgi:hypothetical protein
LRFASLALGPPQVGLARLAAHLKLPISLDNSPRPDITDLPRETP